MLSSSGIVHQRLKDRFEVGRDARVEHLERAVGAAQIRNFGNECPADRETDLADLLLQAGCDRDDAAVYVVNCRVAGHVWTP